MGLEDFLLNLPHPYRNKFEPNSWEYILSVVGASSIVFLWLLILLLAICVYLVAVRYFEFTRPKDILHMRIHLFLLTCVCGFALTVATLTEVYIHMRIEETLVPEQEKRTIHLLFHFEELHNMLSLNMPKECVIRELAQIKWYADNWYSQRVIFETLFASISNIEYAVKVIMAKIPFYLDSKAMQVLQKMEEHRYNITLAAWFCALSTCSVFLVTVVLASRPAVENIVTLGALGGCAVCCAVGGAVLARVVLAADACHEAPRIAKDLAPNLTYKALQDYTQSCKSIESKVTKFNYHISSLLNNTLDGLIKTEAEMENRIGIRMDTDAAVCMSRLRLGVQNAFRESLRVNKSFNIPCRDVDELVTDMSKPLCDYAIKAFFVQFIILMFTALLFAMYILIFIHSRSWLRVHKDNKSYEDTLYQSFFVKWIAKFGTRRKKEDEDLEEIPEIVDENNNLAATDVSQDPNMTPIIIQAPNTLGYPLMPAQFYEATGSYLIASVPLDNSLSSYVTPAGIQGPSVVYPDAPYWPENVIPPQSQAYPMMYMVQPDMQTFASVPQNNYQAFEANYVPTGQFHSPGACWPLPDAQGVVGAELTPSQMQNAFWSATMQQNAYAQGVYDQTIPEPQNEFWPNVVVSESDAQSQKLDYQDTSELILAEWSSRHFGARNSASQQFSDNLSSRVFSAKSLKTLNTPLSQVKLLQQEGLKTATKRQLDLLEEMSEHHATPGTSHDVRTKPNRTDNKPPACKFVYKKNVCLYKVGKK